MSSFKTKIAQGLVGLVLPENGAVESVAIEISWADAGAGIAAGDVVHLCDLPAGFEIKDYSLLTDDIDTGTTAAASFGELNAAKTGLAVTYKAGITAFQAGGVQRNDTAGLYLQDKTQSKSLGLVFTGANAGGQANKRATLLLDLAT